MPNLNVFNGPRHTLPVSEIFTSIQGEGVNTGEISTFIRFAGCNLKCDWCDTKYTWDDEELEKNPPHHATIEQIIANVAPEITNIVFTGGEPLMQQKNPTFKKLLDELRMKAPACDRFEFETNGLVAPEDWLVQGEKGQAPYTQFNISPKLSNSGNNTNLEVVARNMFADFFVPFMLQQGNYIPYLKFVVGVTDDVHKEINEVEEFLGLMLKAQRDRNEDFEEAWAYLLKQQVILMPEGETREAQLKKMPIVFRAALERGFIHVSPRLHTLVWDNQKGV